MLGMRIELMISGLFDDLIDHTVVWDRRSNQLSQPSLATIHTLCNLTCHACCTLIHFPSSPPSHHRLPAHPPPICIYALVQQVLIYNLSFRIRVGIQATCRVAVAAFTVVKPRYTGYYHLPGSMNPRKRLASDTQFPTNSAKYSRTACRHNPGGNTDGLKARWMVHVKETFKLAGETVGRAVAHGTATSLATLLLIPIDTPH